MKRSKELFMRWAEMAAFTPVMRTHEGNRPGDNHQFDSDEETLEHLAAMTKLYTHLKPYMQAAVAENTNKGRDSNPRYVSVYTLSRRAPSATRFPTPHQ